MTGRVFWWKASGKVTKGADFFLWERQEKKEMGLFPNQGERNRADPSLSFTGQDPEQLATIKSYLQPYSNTVKSSPFHAYGWTAV